MWNVPLAVEQAKLTIDNRVNQYGVAEPSIARQGVEGDRIVVQLPGVDDPERATGGGEQPVQGR